MKRRAKPQTSGGVVADINITPMVDVLLCLLILQMVIQPGLQKGLDLQLPLSERTDMVATTAARDQIVLRVTQARLCLERAGRAWRGPRAHPPRRVPRPAEESALRGWGRGPPVRGGHPRRGRRARRRPGGRGSRTARRAPAWAALAPALQDASCSSRARRPSGRRRCAGSSPLDLRHRREALALHPAGQSSHQRPQVRGAVRSSADVVITASAPASRYFDDLRGRCARRSSRPATPRGGRAGRRATAAAGGSRAACSAPASATPRACRDRSRAGRSG